MFVWRIRSDLPSKLLLLSKKRKHIPFKQVFKKKIKKKIAKGKQFDNQVSLSSKGVETHLTTISALSRLESSVTCAASVYFRMSNRHTWPGAVNWHFLCIDSTNEPTKSMNMYCKRSLALTNIQYVDIRWRVTQECAAGQRSTFSGHCTRVYS